MGVTERRRRRLGHELGCTMPGRSTRYAGETGKNMYMKGCNYVADVDKKRTNKPLWKHIVEKQRGVMAVPMFSHFKMKLVKILTQPQGGRQMRV